MVRTVLYILMVLGVMASGRSVVFGETSLLQKNWFAPRMASFCKNSESPNSINRFSLRSSNCQQGGGGEPTPSSLTFSKIRNPSIFKKPPIFLPWQIRGQPNCPGVKGNSSFSPPSHGWPSIGIPRSFFTISGPSLSHQSDGGTNCTQR